MANITVALDGVKKEQRGFTDAAGKIMADAPSPFGTILAPRHSQGTIGNARESLLAPRGPVESKGRIVYLQLGIAPALARMQQASTRSLALLDGRPPQ